MTAVVTEDLDRFVSFDATVFGLAVIATLEDEHGRHAVLATGPRNFLHAFERPAGPHARGSSALLDRGAL